MRDFHSVSDFGDFFDLGGDAVSLVTRETPDAMITILYFARLRERLGCHEERLDLPAGVGTITDLLEHLRTRGGLWAEALSEGERIMSAVNQEIAQPRTSIRDGDEVAFFPPVTGG